MSQRANISLATLADEPVESGSEAALERLCSRISIEPLGRERWLRGIASLARGRTATEGLFYSSKLRRTIRQWSRNTRWDAVFVFCSSMVQYADIPELEGVPVIIDLVDVDSQKFLDYAQMTKGPKRWLYRLEGRRLRGLECSLPARCQAVLLVSEREADVYRAVCPNDRTFAVSNGVDLNHFRPDAMGSDSRPELSEDKISNLVFVGALDYQANIDGVTWFVHNVWPMLRCDFPNLTLGLVGRNPGPSILSLADVPGIRVFADVPDVRPYLAGADAVIAPLRIARGIQNKVLEAMAMGRPVLCSPAALEGIDAVPGRDVHVCESPNEYLQVLRQLH